MNKIVLIEVDINELMYKKLYVLKQFIVKFCIMRNWIIYRFNINNFLVLVYKQYIIERIKDFCIYVIKKLLNIVYDVISENYVRLFQL